ESATYSEAVERVRALVAESVKSHLVSDVPLGAFLSGGLDSSIVVALMRQATNATIRTCSVTFAEREYDESGFARQVAQRFGAEHMQVRVTGADVAMSLSR